MNDKNYFQNRLDAFYEVLKREYGASRTLDIDYMVDEYLKENRGVKE